MKMQLINRNPADFVEVPKQKKYRAAFLDEEQVKMMLDAFEASLLYIPVLLAVGLGLRGGEALGLQWQDIDFENNTITIERALLIANGKVIFHDPKTETNKRMIVASLSMLDILKKHREKQEEVKAVMGEAYINNDLVVCYDDGHPIHPGTFSRAFRDMLIRRKLPLIRFHDLRHTNATLMLKHNVPAKVASERLGHSTIGITLDLYSHVMKEMQAEAADKLDNAIFNKRS